MRFFTLCLLIISLPLIKAENPIKDITLRECILMALEYNDDLLIVGYDPRINQEDVTIAESVFDPTLSSTVAYTHTKQQVEINNANKKQTGQYQVGIQKANSLGGSVGFFYTIDYQKTDVVKSLYQNTLDLQVTQSLLKNFGVSTNTAGIRVAENNVDIAYHQFRLTALNTLNLVELAYLNLINTQETYRYLELSLELSQSFYEITQARIRFGALAESDVYNAERDLTQKKDDLLVGQSNLELAENQLKQLINPSDVNFYRNIRLRAVDKAVFNTTSIDFQKSLEYALKSRDEIQQSKLVIKNAYIDVEFQKNQLLPNLDLAASLALLATDGRNSDAFQLASQGEFPTWTFSLSFNYPLGNRSAEANHKRAILVKRQTKAQHNQVVNVVVFEVQEAIRDLKIAMPRVTLAQQTREFAEKQLENDLEKYRSGLIDLFELQTTEQNLTVTRINEVNTLIAYLQAKANLEKAEGALDKIAHRNQVKLGIE